MAQIPSMYEMFLGPIERKAFEHRWNSGVHSFLKKLAFIPPQEVFSVSDDAPSADALKTLHQTIKKVTEDIENFS